MQTHELSAEQDGAPIRTRRAYPSNQRAIKKPFDVLAEGLSVSFSRDNRTAIELFRQGLNGWDAGLKRQFDN